MLNENIRQRLAYHFHHPNYLYFLISLVLLIIAPPLAMISISGRLVIEILFGLVILMGAFFVTTSFKELVLTLALGGFLFLSFLEGMSDPSFSVVSVFANLFFFGFLFWKLINYILRSEEVNANSLFACISAYLILGIIGVPICNAIEHYYPQAFTLPEGYTYYDMVYFCFITITSVGFGDITPTNDLAKGLAMLLSISGQLYITFVVAIIIGKYLASEAGQNESSEV